MISEENIEFNISIDKFDFGEKLDFVIFSCIFLVSGILLRVCEIANITGNLLIVGGSILGFVTLVFVLPSTEKTRLKMEESERRLLTCSRWINSTKDTQELEEVRRKLATVIKLRKDLPRVRKEKKEECEQIIEEYIDKQEEKIREMMNCSIEELRRIKGRIEKEIEIRKEIQRRAIHEEYGEYKILFNDKDDIVRDFVADNPNATKFEEFRSLLQDKNKNVRSYAASTLKKLEKKGKE